MFRSTFVSLSATLLIASGVSIPAGSAPSEGSPEIEKPMGLFAVGSGGSERLAELRTEATLHVTGIVATGEIEQEFENRSSELIEAEYLFPLPESAKVDRMRLVVGDRTIESTVRRRAAARKVYRAAVAEGRKAALAETGDQGLFRVVVGGVEPGQRVSVQLTYRDLARYENGAMSVTLPFTVTPRYAPRSKGGRPAARLTYAGRSEAAQRVTRVTARIDAGPMLGDVESPGHELERHWEGETRVARIVGPDLRPNRDVTFEWEPQPSREPRMLVHAASDAGHGVAVILPPAHQELVSLPTETLFLVDVSGSMQGPSIRIASKALLTAIDALGPQDSYNVMTFNDRTERVSDRFAHRGEPDALRIEDFARGLEATGGTEIYGALQEALDLLSLSEPRGVRRLVFLTDGAVGRRDDLLRTLSARLGETRLHVLGIGHAPNRHLLGHMASLGRGLSQTLPDLDEETGERVERFLARIDAPLLSDLELDWNGADVTEVTPSRLRDLHAGEPIVVAFESGGGGAPLRVTLRGSTEEGPFARTFEAREVEQVGLDARSLSATWGAMRVDEALQRLAAGAPRDEIEAEVVPIALAHRLVTPFTSLVAEERVSSFGGSSYGSSMSRVRVPLALPVGAGGDLPRGGTLASLYRFLGWLLIVTGLSLVVAHRLTVSSP